MSDGKLTFDTRIDNTGFKADLAKLGKGTGDVMNTAGSAFEKTGGKLTKYITKPALGAATALAGLSLVKGFNRLKNIDTARAQLEGLGHTAGEVEGIMDSAMKAVKGTAYGFDEAATAAASAVSSGIAPGKELTRYLGLVGDAAAQSRLSFTDMGSIFNKVMASGKISMEEVNQLADQGIPIYKMLSEQLGVTQADVRDMVSAGKVDSETFLKAIETNIGGAAKVMGEKSFVGAVANIGASLGRIGANFLDAGGKGGGFFSQLKPLMADFMETLGRIEEKSAEWGEAFGKTFSRAVKIISEMPGGLRAAALLMPLLAGPSLKFAGGMIKSVAALNQFKAASSGASIVVGVLGGELKASQAILGTLGNKTVSAGKKMKGALASVKNAALEQLQAYRQADARLQTVNALYGKNAASIYRASNATMGNTAANLKNRASLPVSSLVKHAAALARDTASTVLNTAAKAKNRAGMSISALAKHTGALIRNAAATASGTAASLLHAAATSKAAYAASGAAARLLALAAAHRAAMVAALGLAAPVIAIAAYMAKTGASAEETAARITAFSDRLAAGITAFAEGFPAMVDSAVAGITGVVNALVGALPTLIPLIIGAGLQLFMGLVDALIQVMEPLVSVLPTIIDAVTSVLPTLIPLIIGAGIQLFMGLVNSLAQIIPLLVGALPQIISAVVAALPTLIPALVNAGVMLFMGLVEAIPQVIPPLIAAIPQIISAIVGAIGVLVPAIIEAGITLLMALVEAIPQVIPPLVAAIPQIISAIVDSIGVLVPAIIEAGITLLMALIDAIPQVIPPLVAAIPQIIYAIVSALLSALPHIFSVGVQLLKKLWGGISSWAGSLKSNVLSLARSLPGKISDGIGSLLSIGGDWIKGLWNGIGAKKDWLCKKIKGLASDAKNAIKDFFGINSPSTVMRDEVGRYISEGIAVGIEGQTPELVAAAQLQAGKIKSAYFGSLNSGVTEKIGARYARREGTDVNNVNTTNVEQTINFYSEQKSPIAIGRILKTQAMYGLAGI